MPSSLMDRGLRCLTKLHKVTVLLHRLKNIYGKSGEAIVSLSPLFAPENAV